MSSPAWFVTLTYAPDKVPENGSLVPRDITLFVKRLRKAHPERRISYYVAGEYGETTARPHYHAVLYGARFLDRDVRTTRHNAPVYKSESLERCWGLGLCEFTPLTYGAARYCASYVRKKLRIQDHPDHYTRVDPRTGELVDLEREYGRMSRRPAIGRRWIERFWRDVYPKDYVVMDGMELKPPRYYDKWMDNHHPRVMFDVRRKRMEEIKDVDVLTLQARERTHLGRISLFEGRGAV